MSTSLRFDLVAPSSDLHEYARPNDTIVLHEVRDGVPSGRVVLAHIVAAGDLRHDQPEGAPRKGVGTNNESGGEGARALRAPHEGAAMPKAPVTVAIRYDDLEDGS